MRGWMFTLLQEDRDRDPVTEATIHVVQLQFRRDEPTETAGGITEAVPDDDVGLRQGTLESMHNQVNEC